MKDPQRYAAHLVDHYLGARIDATGPAPGLREAVIDLVAAAIPGHLEPLMRTQLDLLTHPSSRRFPDAYLADRATAEDALQKAAAGLRTALAQAGHLVNAQAFERGTAARLRDDARPALRGELARIPRPLTRPEALGWSLDPAPWFNDSQEQTPWPPPGLAAVADLRSLPEGAGALARVDEGPRAGWIQIGLIERQHTPARRYPDQPARRVLIIVGLEAAGDDPPPDTLPLSQAPWQLWTRPLQRLAPALTQAGAAEHLSITNQALVALTDAGATPMVDAPPRRSGPGLPPYVLAPAASVVSALGLQPTGGICGFSLSDTAGEALICRQWRGHLVHDGGFEPLLPMVAGADLLIRPDVFTSLHAAIGPARCQAGINVRHMSVAQDDDIPDDED
ncbi:hypothetical protein GCM10010293_61850 [Streptomyces griseoflavus]|uniref:hypothetical protein n=1 Tax=Streptomyces griseoflavus TaxID=35619 RepID=UPI00167E077D|nr:hypothetical protein [Streptomyces griseoflavus]GGV50666.1 hypothetical protein GCM10010293_61850 [Streptomyces griseoflavus]